MRKYILAILLIPTLGWTQVGQREIVGEFMLSDVLLQPRFYTKESGTQRFELDRSYFYFSWQINKNLSAQFGLGQYELVNPNNRIESNIAKIGDYDQLRFFEAFAEWNSEFGKFRAGMIPLFLGWEATRRESEWHFPRTLFYENHEFGFRDMGFSYFIDSRGFYTEFAIHNGENGNDVDGKLWHSARVGWTNKKGFDGALSAANGKYENSKLAPIYEFSYFNTYLSLELSHMFVLLEGFFVKQKMEGLSPAEVHRWDYHLDISHSVTSWLDGLVRYEAYESDNNVPDGRMQRGIFGVRISNELKTSSLFLWGIINKKEGRSSRDNEIQVLWKVRSLSIF